MAAKDDYLVDLLVDMGAVTNDQLVGVRADADATGEGVVDLCLTRKIITPVDVTRAKAAQFGAEVVSLSEMRLSDDVIATIPRHIAKRYKVVPIFKNEEESSGFVPERYSSQVR